MSAIVESIAVGVFAQRSSPDQDLSQCASVFSVNVFLCVRQLDIHV